MTRRLRLALALGLSTFLVLAGTVGASAVWSTANVALPATANAASISSTVGQSGGLNTATYKYTGTASDLKIGMLTYANTGTAPVAVTLAVSSTNSTVAAATQLQLWTTTATSCETTVPTGALTSTLATTAPALPTAFAQVAAGATVKLCAATHLTSALSAVQGQSLTATFALTGKVGANWTTNASASFTQSVYRVPPATAPTCKNNALDVQLTWTAAVGATRYDLYRADGTTFIKSVTATTASIGAAELGYAVLGPTVATHVVIRAYDGTFGSTSTDTSAAVNVQSILGLLLPGTRCPV